MRNEGSFRFFGNAWSCSGGWRNEMTLDEVALGVASAFSTAGLMADGWVQVSPFWSCGRSCLRGVLSS